jgi:hypothetical protein
MRSVAPIFFCLPVCGGLHADILSTYAQGINGSGQIVGAYENSSGNQGFVDTNGAFTTISEVRARLATLLGY